MSEFETHICTSHSGHVNFHLNCLRGKKKKNKRCQLHGVRSLLRVKVNCHCHSSTFRRGLLIVTVLDDISRRFIRNGQTVSHASTDGSIKGTHTNIFALSLSSDWLLQHCSSCQNHRDSWRDVIVRVGVCKVLTQQVNK